MSVPDDPNQTPRAVASSPEVVPLRSPWAMSFWDWFKGLPAAGQVAIAAVAIVFGISLLNTVLKLVAAVLSVAVLAIILYLLYRRYLIDGGSSSDG
ncbi:MAG: hypothetical protein HC890_15945 [Chloroflexaceae bacterium]|nr:hypothetical protein [Chloroflexaceae bacterium]